MVQLGQYKPQTLWNQYNNKYLKYLKYVKLIDEFIIYIFL